MATYVTDDGEPHATAIATDRTTAARLAFAELLTHHGRDDIEIVRVQDLGLNPEFSHNVPAHTLRLEYDTTPDEKPPENVDVEPVYKTITVDANPILPNGEPATFDDNPEDSDIRWKASVVDHIRYLDD